MEVKIQRKAQSLVEIEIKTTEQEWQNARHLALRKLNQKVKVKGFRAGFIPENLLIEEIGGENAFQEKIIEILIPQTYTEAVKEEKLAVITSPQVEIIQPQPLVYKATIAIYPEIKLPDYQKIKEPKKEIKVTIQEVEEVLKNLAKQLITYKQVERPAQKGDRIEIDFNGFDLSGIPLEGMSSKNHPLILGEGGFIPGFEDQIVGMVKESEKEFPIEFPKDYKQTKFKGKEVKFMVRLNTVEETILPPLDDSLAEKLSGKKQNLEELKQWIEKMLLSQKKTQEKDRRENAWLKSVSKKTNLEIPQILIQEEGEARLEELKQKGKKQGLSWQQILTHLQKTEAEIKQETEKQAAETVKLRLILKALLDAEKIEVSEAEIKTASQKFLEQKQQSNSLELRKLQHQLMLDKLFQKVLD